jgi:uncharacterized repeat protein (TIGR01451 family)
VATFRSDAIDNTLDVGGPAVSNALDAVTNYGDPGATSNTFAEVSDGVVNYFFDVSFGSNGEVVSPLLITQFLYDPPGTDTVEEWVQIQNVSLASVAITGFKLGDEETIGGGEGMRAFPAGGVLAPGQLVVVAVNAAGFQALYGVAPDYDFSAMAAYSTWAGGGVALSNAGDEVLLLDPSDTAVDVASYGTGVWPGVSPHPLVTTGHSLRRVGADTDNSGVDFIDDPIPNPLCCPRADLGVTKTDGQATAVAGLPIAYTITVTNAGPSAVTGATVTDTLPSTLQGATWTCSASAGSSCSAAGAGSINDTVNLLAGGTLTYSLNATVHPAAAPTQQLVNTATVTTPAGVTEADPGNNVATDTDTLTREADLSITKTDGQTTAGTGQPVTYTITVANAGPSAVTTPGTGAIVTDTVPAILQGVTWTCSASPGSFCVPGGGGNLNETVRLLVGGTVTYTLSGTVDPGAAGTLVNTASVSGEVVDPNPGNDTATDTDTIIVLPSLAVNDIAIAEGNAGPTTATFTVTLSSASLAEVTVNYATQDVSATAGTDYVYTDGILTFAPGQTSRTIDVTVNGDTDFEPIETFQVVLSSPSSAMIADGVGIGTIPNDDAPPGPSRVFVAVTGADTNDCSNIATPCRTLNAAIGQVAVEGEVIVTKSGSYAGASITKPLKLDAASGVVAFSGQPIVVNAGDGTVVIRGLTLKALTPGTGSGLSIQAAGAVFVENTVIDGWSAGIAQQGAAEVFVKDSVLRNNSIGLSATTGKTTIDNARFTNNGSGIASNVATVSVRGSTLSGNTTGFDAQHSFVTVEKCQIANNGSGIKQLSVVLGSYVRLSRSVVSGNQVGLENQLGAFYVSGTNAIRGNVVNTQGDITTTGLQ